jgi:hypothetical protein
MVASDGGVGVLRPPWERAVMPLLSSLATSPTWPPGGWSVRGQGAILNVTVLELPPAGVAIS